jgi:hypothetical protein
MADAQDLKSYNKRFYGVSLAFIRVCFSLVFIGLNAHLRRLFTSPDFDWQSSTNGSTEIFSQVVENQKDDSGLKFRASGLIL